MYSNDIACFSMACCFLGVSASDTHGNVRTVVIHTIGASGSGEDALSLPFWICPHVDGTLFEPLPDEGRVLMGEKCKVRTAGLRLCDKHVAHNVSKRVVSPGKLKGMQTGEDGPQILYEGFLRYE